jgi:hypothetical protein
MSYMDFSSWPRDQEQTFVVYEQRAIESQKKAFMVGLVAAIGVLVLALGIYAGVEPDKRDIAKDMNMSNLTKKVKKGGDSSEAAPAPKQEQPKQDAPKTEAPKTDTPAPATDKAPAAAPTDKK